MQFKNIPPKTVPQQQYAKDFNNNKETTDKFQKSFIYDILKHVLIYYILIYDF